MRSHEAHLRGVVSRQSEAAASLKRPGDIAVVHRRTDRALVLRCPDGCGEILTINLDRRVGKAWRLYRTARGISLYPSVWRQTGCKSHFVLWENHIFWDDYWRPLSDAERRENLEQRILGKMTDERFTSAEILADYLDEIPWAVLEACRRLVAAGILEEGLGQDKGSFRLRSGSTPE